MASVYVVALALWLKHNSETI